MFGISLYQQAPQAELRKMLLPTTKANENKKVALDSGAWHRNQKHINDINLSLVIVMLE